MSTALKLVQLTGGTAHDLPAIDRLMQAAFDPRYGEAWTSGQCLGVMAMPGVWLTLAHVDERPAGFALTRVIVDEAELLLLATTPKQRRAGIGSALLRSVLADAAGRGAVRLHLEVRANNAAAAFYTRHGFTKVGERRAYYRGTDGVQRDAHTYARDLP